MSNKYVNRMKRLMSQTPSNYSESKEYYKDALAYKIGDVHEFASNNELIGFEETFGTLVFSDLLCRVNHAINPKTGSNLGDDFKELKFFQLDAEITMGMRFNFSNSVWIVVNTDNYKYITKSCVVRRCNNVLRYINKHGEIVTEPCVMGYGLVYSNIYRNDPVNAPQGTVDVIVQYNEQSRAIRHNDRFLIGSQAYVVKSIEDTQRTETFNDASYKVLTFQLEIDDIANDDDFVLGVANMDRYKGIYPPASSDEVVLSPNQDYILLGDTIKFNCFRYINDVVQEDSFTFVASDVPSDRYEFSVVDGNSFIIKNKKEYLSGKLKISCQSDSISKDFYISLRGNF